MTSEEIAEALRAFRTIVRVVGLFDARMWLRTQHGDLEWALAKRINDDGRVKALEYTKMKVFSAPLELWVEVAEEMEAEHRE